MQRIAGFLAVKKLEYQLENTLFFSNEVILAVTKFIEKFMNTKEKPPKSEDLSGFSWSCWADSNRRPHPYQAALELFSNYFSYFIAIYTPICLLSATF